MKLAISIWFQKGPTEDQKGYPRKQLKQHLKKADLPLVQENIRIWRLIPLGPRGAGVNRKAISQNGIKERK